MRMVKAKIINLYFLVISIKYVQLAKVKCVECMESVDGKNCVNVDNMMYLTTKECDHGVTYCSTITERFGNELLTIERNCANEECKKEIRSCKSAGRDSFLYERCITCCEGQRCNTDNAVQFSSDCLFVLTTVLSVHLL